MRTSATLFWVITVFFFASAIAYTVWSWFYYPHHALEPVGTVALTLTGVLGAFIAFFLARTHATQNGVELPEDRLDANIDDGDPELGHFSPWSWWPFMLGLSVAIGALGIAVGWWIVPIGGGLAVVSLVGWVYEYYRGYFAR
jgi:hypothetical protein